MTGSPSRRDFKKTRLLAQTKTEQPGVSAHLAMAGLPRKDGCTACWSKPHEDSQTSSEGSS